MAAGTLSSANWADEVEEEEEEVAKAASPSPPQQAAEKPDIPAERRSPSSASHQAYVPPAHRHTRDTIPRELSPASQDGWRRGNSEGGRQSGEHAHSHQEPSWQRNALPQVSPPPPPPPGQPSHHSTARNESQSHAELLQMVQHMLKEHEEAVLRKVDRKLDAWADSLAHRVTESVMQRMATQAHDKGNGSSGLGQLAASTIAPSAAEATASPESGSPAHAHGAARVSVFSRLGNTGGGADGQGEGAGIKSAIDGEGEASKARPAKPTRAGFGVYTPPARGHGPAPGLGHDSSADAMSKSHPYDRAATGGAARNARYLDR